MRQLDTYKRTAIRTSSPTQLVVMLYEGALLFSNQCVDAIRKRDIERKRQSVDRLVAILHHLQSTLDREQGQEIAANLDRLYTYITSRVMEASLKLDIAPLEEAIKLLTVLLSGWNEVVKKEQEHTVPTTLLTQQASNGGLQLHA